MNRLITAVSIILCSLFAQADYLYWMLDTTGSDPVVEFNYARVVVSGSGVAAGTYLTMADTDLTDVLYSGFDPNDEATWYGTGKNTLSTYSDLAKYNSDVYGFAVELYNAQDQLVGRSERIDYAALRASIYADLGTTGVEPYIFTAAAVPEPTGGMLFGFGLALLALRRRRPTTI